MTARQEDLEALDDVLSGVRRVLQRPGYRRQFLAELGVPVSLGTLRAVRTVQRLGTPGPCMREVAGELAIDASTASRLVDDAVRNGYLTRRPGGADQRRIALQLSDEGRDLLGRADEVRRKLLEQVTRDWTGDELHTLVALLDRLVRDLDRLERP